MKEEVHENKVQVCLPLFSEKNYKVAIIVTFQQYSISTLSQFLFVTIIVVLFFLETSPRSFELSAPPVRHKEPSRALSSGNWRNSESGDGDDDDGGGWIVSCSRVSDKWRGTYNILTTVQKPN